MMCFTCHRANTHTPTHTPTHTHTHRKHTHTHTHINTYTQVKLKRLQLLALTDPKFRAFPGSDFPGHEELEELVTSYRVRKRHMLDALEKDDPEIDVHLSEVLKRQAAAMLVNWRRFCAPQLEGGAYHNPSDALTEQMKDVPTTNQAGERPFGILNHVLDTIRNAKYPAVKAVSAAMVNRPLERLKEWCSTNQFRALLQFFRVGSTLVKQVETKHEEDKMAESLRNDEEKCKDEDAKERRRLVKTEKLYALASTKATSAANLRDKFKQCEQQAAKWKGAKGKKAKGTAVHEKETRRKEKLMMQMLKQQRDLLLLDGVPHRLLPKLKNGDTELTPHEYLDKLTALISQRDSGDLGVLTPPRRAEEIAAEVESYRNGTPTKQIKEHRVDEAERVRALQTEVRTDMKKPLADQPEAEPIDSDDSDTDETDDETEDADHEQGESEDDDDFGEGSVTLSEAAIMAAALNATRGRGDALEIQNFQFAKKVALQDPVRGQEAVQFFSVANADPTKRQRKQRFGNLGQW
jgi:hypothetical protein